MLGLGHNRADNDEHNGLKTESPLQALKLAATT